MRKPRTALTLVELLVVIAVLGALVGIAVPAIMKVRESANVARCQNQLRQLGLAVQNYHSVAGTMPPYATGPKGTPPVGWFFYLLPEVDQDNVLRENAPYNIPYEFLNCPTDPTRKLETYSGKTSYVANWYALAVGGKGYYAPAQPFASLTDGTSNVLLFAEAYQVCNNMPRIAIYSPGYHNFGITQEQKPSDDPSYAPNDYTMFQAQPLAPACDRWRSQTSHAAMNVCMADGSVRTIPPSIDPVAWTQLLKPCDGMPQSTDW